MSSPEHNIEEHTLEGDSLLEDDAIPEEDAAPDDAESSPKRSNKKKRDGSTLRKAPQAPKRFKSSYICFFMAKQPEIKDELGDKATVTEISKRSAEMWRNITAEERAYWDDVAAKDKQRYMAEKASYTGPWQVPWKRQRKDPSAPKRPMSAFLYFSQDRRRKLKEQNPSLKNTDISRMLGEMWRNAAPEERQPHIDKEREEREKYKIAIAEWREDYEAKAEAQKKAQAEQAAFAANSYDPAVEGQADPSVGQVAYGDPAAMGYYNAQPQYNGGYGYGHGYAYAYPQQASYQYSTGGRAVILGPNGMPYQAPHAAAQPPMAEAQPPHYYMPPNAGYDDSPTSASSSAPLHYDYGSDHMGQELKAE